MSTRTTIAQADHGGLSLHLYHEMHDACVHLTLSGRGSKEGCYSMLDLVIPNWMVEDLGQMLQPGSEVPEKLLGEDPLIREETR